MLYFVACIYFMMIFVYPPLHRIFTDSFRTNVDHTIALLAAADIPPLSSVLPATIIVQVPAVQKFNLCLSRSHHALLLQHPALLARSAATFHKRAGFSPMRWTSTRHYEDRLVARPRFSIYAVLQPLQEQLLGRREGLEHGPCRVSDCDCSSIRFPAGPFLFTLHL